MRVSELRVSDPEKKRPCQLFFARLFPSSTEISEFQSFGCSCPQPIKVGPSDFFSSEPCQALSLNNHSRKGHIYLFIPRHNLDRLAVNVDGKGSTFDVVANTPGSDTSGGKLCIGRIISIPVVVRGDGSDMNGEVLVTF
jgi:hypothetical protein